MMIMKCQFPWWRKPEDPDNTNDLWQVGPNCNFHAYGLCPVTVPNPGRSVVKPSGLRCHESSAFIIPINCEIEAKPILVYELLLNETVPDVIHEVGP